MHRLSEEVRVITGAPDPDKISTNYVERRNLTMRMGMRLLTRLTNGASPLNLTIIRDATGRITVAEGLPAWMDGKPLGCAPLHPN